MKRKIVLIGLLPLFVSCTSTTETIEENAEKGKVTKIFVYSDGADTRTSTNGSSVTWAAGDKIGLVKITDATTNNQFELTSSPGSNKGYFGAVTPADALEPGKWMAYYPYNASKYTVDNPLELFVIPQNGENNNHLAEYDWLISTAPADITYNGENHPAFLMKHCFSLIKINVTLANNVTKNRPTLSNVKLLSKDSSPCFVNSAWIDENGEMQYDYSSNNTTVVRTDAPELKNAGQKHTLWLLTRQNVKTDLQIGLFITVNYVPTGFMADFTPTNMLEPGKLYTLDLQLNYDNVNYGSSTIQIVNH